MHEIFRQMEENVPNILNSKQINHYYTIIKDESLRNDNLKTINDLSEKVLSTLKYLMGSLLLQSEFNMIAESYKKKVNQEGPGPTSPSSNQIEFVIKGLLRCRKWFEAKHDVIKIMI